MMGRSRNWKVEVGHWVCALEECILFMASLFLSAFLGAVG
jgi:hypothetical protein